MRPTGQPTPSNCPWGERRTRSKPAARIVNPLAGIEKLRREGRCRVCKRKPSGHYVDALNRMHLVPKSQRGDDVDDNIVPGCGSGTAGCHGVLTSRNRDGATGRTWEEVAGALRATLTKEEIAYVVAKKSAAWLDEHYPERGRKLWP